MERLFDDIEGYLKREREKKSLPESYKIGDDPVHKKFFLSRVFTTIINKLNEEASPAFKRGAIYTAAAYTALILWYQPFTHKSLDSWYNFATPTEKIVMLTPISNGNCWDEEFIRLVERKSVKMEPGECINKRSWATQQLELLESRIPKR